MLVHQAIGKNPTRYRQIIETESSDILTLDEQGAISEDQKHSSTVAKVFYKKKQSRLVTIGGQQCKSRVGIKSNLVAVYNEMAINLTSRRIIEENSLPSTSGLSSVYTSGQLGGQTIDPIENNPCEAVNSSRASFTTLIWELTKTLQPVRKLKRRELREMHTPPKKIDI